MAGVGPGDLHGLADDLLAACVAALDSIPAAPNPLLLYGAPDRSFVTYQPPVADCCPQLTVDVRPITEAPTEPLGLGAGTRHRQDFRINHVQFVATLFRCVPVPSGTTPPTAAEQEAAAEQLNADAWALWNHVWNRMRAGLLFSTCSGVFWEGLRPIQPSGGCGGWTLTIRAEVEGYEETITP